MLTPVWATRFRRDVKLVEKRGRPIAKLKAVLTLLIEEKPIPPGYKDHPLKGDWKGFRDLHIEPDWLLRYRIEGKGTSTRSNGDPRRFV